jgi:hypothetical protein
MAIMPHVLPMAIFTTPLPMLFFPPSIAFGSLFTTVLPMAV